MSTSNELPLGFLSIEVDIHRPAGDPFNPQTWPFPLIHELVHGSKESQIVTKDAYDDALLSRFVEAGKKLVERGAIGLITSCGFLALAQNELSVQLDIPIATSALVQIPSILAFIPTNAVVGVLTYDETRLGEPHLRALSIDPAKVRICGMPASGHLRAVIQDGVPYDAAVMEIEIVEQAMTLVEQAKCEGSSVKAIVMECTQMPPYAAAVQQATRLPVYDVYTMGQWFYSGLNRQTPPAWENAS